MKIVYVSHELHKELKVLAAEKGITLGELVELAIKFLKGEN